MDKKTQRMDYLQEVLKKYLNTEPEITMEELAFCIYEQLCDEDLLKFIKKYKKEFKNI